MNVNNEQFPDIANLIRFYLCAPGIAPVWKGYLWLVLDSVLDVSKNEQ